MNSDQINSLIRSILKIAGAALAAHGLTKAAAIVNAEDTIGVAMTIVALVMSHASHGTDKTKGTNAMGVFVWLLLPALLFTGCTLERRVTTINTPAVYDLHSNLVTAATSKTVTEKERLWLPEGYVLMTEDDMFGIKVEMTSQSSALPNIIAGEHHGSLTWVPTSTNQMYAASISKQGSIDNKAVPFWMSSKAGITFGNAFITQNADTNATPQSTAGASVPGTPAPQQTK